MDQELIDFVAQRAEILVKTGASKQETKDAAAAWLAASSDPEKVEQATEDFINYLDGRPNTIENAIAFAEGPAKAMFGEEAAAEILAINLARKENGEKYCNCEACGTVVEILTKFGRI